MRIKHLIGVAAVALCSINYTISAYAQAAGAGADYNKADRAATALEAKRQRVEKCAFAVR